MNRVKHDLVEFKVQCLKVFCYHGNKSTILLFYSLFRTTPEVSSKRYFLKYVKSQRSYGFLITKELIFGFQVLYLKDHFSDSLIFGKTGGVECFTSKGFFHNLTRKLEKQHILL